MQPNNVTVSTFGQQGQLKPGTALTLATCYRTGSSGTGQSTAPKVPGAQLDVNGTGSVTTKALADGVSCAP